jgi:polar amino acid transport system substrate-binding protein
LKIFDTVQDVWAAVASGQVKAGVTAGADTIFAAKQGEIPKLRVVSTYQSPSPIPRVGIAVRKGNSDLLTKINASLAKLEADGTVKAIFLKYGVDDWAPPK